MRSVAVIIAGIIFSALSFLAGFVPAAIIGFISQLMFGDVNVIEGAITFASYTTVIGVILYGYMVISGKLVIEAEDSE